MANTPCEIPWEGLNENGKWVKEYHCPYKGTYTGYESEMCRVCCGEGVDEDSYPDEPYPYEE